MCPEGQPTAGWGSKGAITGLKYLKTSVKYEGRLPCGSGPVYSRVTVTRTVPLQEIVGDFNCTLYPLAELTKYWTLVSVVLTSVFVCVCLNIYIYIYICLSVCLPPSVCLSSNLYLSISQLISQSTYQALYQ